METEHNLVAQQQRIDDDPYLMVRAATTIQVRSGARLGSIRAPGSVPTLHRQEGGGDEEESYYEYGYDDEEASPPSRNKFSSSRQRATAHQEVEGNN